MAVPEKYIGPIKSILASLTANMPGYIARDSQKRMIAGVTTVLDRAVKYEKPDDSDKSDKKDKMALPEQDGNTIIVVEGPTGVGKSLGYLIGSYGPALEKNRKIVVSTATIALQDQLANRDIPRFIENSGLKLTSRIAKGRTRYICHLRLINMVTDGTQVDMFDADEVSASYQSGKAVDVEFYGRLLESYDDKKWDGDRDTLGAAVDDATWKPITTDHNGCTNMQCETYRTCAQMRAREGIRNAQIVVTNHDLLLADFALGGGAILPSPDETFYIVDEAHHLPNKALSMFSFDHRVDLGRTLMNKLATLAGEISRAYPSLRERSVHLSSLTIHLEKRLGEVLTMLSNVNKDLFKDNVWRFANSEFPEQARVLGQQVLKLSKDVLAESQDLQEKIGDMSSDSVDAVANKMRGSLSAYTGMVDAVYQTWGKLMDTPSDKAPPIAKWVERIVYDGHVVDYVVKACPVVAGPMLRDFFYSKVNGLVLASATLRSLGDFDSFLRDSGLNVYPKVSTLALPSPFDYGTQGVLYVPKLNVSAKNVEAHTQAVVRVLPEAIRATGNKGTLVLFASRKKMLEVYEQIPTLVAEMTLVQGTASRGDLLAIHQARIDSGKPSVLFGLQGFAEGLDMPGDYCAHVIIDKLPFAMPTDPIQATLSEWYERRKRSYFNEEALPQASVKLIQATGRLIRTETDYGAITILDERITGTDYGKRILRALPPFKTVTTGTEVLNHIAHKELERV